MRHLIGGMGCIVLGLCGMSAWWPQFTEAMRGFLPFTLLIVGLLAVLSSYNRLSAAEQALGDEEEMGG